MFGASRAPKSKELIETGEDAKCEEPAGESSNSSSSRVPFRARDNTRMESSNQQMAGGNFCSSWLNNHERTEKSDNTSSTNHETCKNSIDHTTEATDDDLRPAKKETQRGEEATEEDTHGNKQNNAQIEKPSGVRATAVSKRRVNLKSKESRYKNNDFAGNEKNLLTEKRRRRPSKDVRSASMSTAASINNTTDEDFVCSNTNPSFSEPDEASSFLEPTLIISAGNAADDFRVTKEETTSTAGPPTNAEQDETSNNSASSHNITSGNRQHGEEEWNEHAGWIDGNPPIASSFPDTPRQQQQRPGAYHVRPSVSSAVNNVDDENNDVPSLPCSSSFAAPSPRSYHSNGGMPYASNDDAVLPPNIPIATGAVLVESVEEGTADRDQNNRNGTHNEHEPIAIATRDKWGINFRNRRIQFLLFGVTLIFIALAVGLGISMSSLGDNDENDTLSPPEQLTWVQIGSDIDGIAARDRLGNAVSFSADGTRLAVASVDNSAAEGLTHVSLVRVYEDRGDDGSWVLLGNDLLGSAPHDEFGYSIALSGNGNRLVVGAKGHDDTVVGNSTGQAKIFEYNSTTRSWTQLGEPIIGEASGDEFGKSVSTSFDGSTVAVGAEENDGVHGEGSGHVRVFQLSEGNWTQLGEDIDGEAPDDSSGRSVSLSSDGRTVAVGAYENDSRGSDSGHVRVHKYDDNDSRWRQLGNDMLGQNSDDWFGFSVSLAASGTTVAVGAGGNDSGSKESGQVRVYQYSEVTNVWNQVGGEVNGEGEGDWFGYSVSLSADGRTFAAGAVRNDGNGDNSGHVRVFRLSGTSWQQLGSDIEGEYENDRSGYAISLSADGSRLAIGAHLNDGNGRNSGHVRVYGLQAV